MSQPGVLPRARLLAVVCTAMALALSAGPHALAEPDSTPGPTGAAAPAADSDQEAVGGTQLGSRNIVTPPGVAKLPSGVNAKAWVVADANSGTVLAARDAHAKYLPASTLKTLTALTLLPKLTDRKKMVVATDQDTNIDGTRVGLVTNGKYSVEMLFQCMLMMSGNDCATALAETAGGVPQTLAAMNSEAKRLHAFDTHAATPSGLDGPNQSSSAYDLALIMREDLKLPDFRRYNTTRQGLVPAQPPKYGSIVFANDNKLLYNYEGVVAAKNGYTDAARHTFVAAATHGKRTLIVTLMNGERSPVDMWEQAASLFNWGFSVPETTAGVGELVPPEDPNAKHSISSAASLPAPGQTKAQTEKASGRSGLGFWAPVAGGAVVFLGLVAGVIRSRRRHHY